MPRSKLTPVVPALVLFLFGETIAAQDTNSPELELLKTLEGRWEGTSAPDNAETVVTFAVTGRGTAVIETLFFPATQVEMTTVYHDDHNGKLVLTHYCSAGNQPYLGIVQSSDNQLQFELSPNDQTIDVENEWHAHGLTTTVNDDGTLVQDWRYWLNGERNGGRNIQLVKAK